MLWRTGCGQGSMRGGRLVLLVSLLLATLPSHGTKQKRHRRPSDGGIMIREVRDSSFSHESHHAGSYGPPPPSLSYGSPEHAPLHYPPPPMHYPPPPMHYPPPPSYTQAQPYYEVEVYEKPKFSHPHRLPQKSKKSEEEKYAIKEGKLEKLFYKGIKHLHKHFMGYEDDDYHSNEPSDEVHHHYEDPQYTTYHRPVYHPPPTPKLVEVRVPKCKARIEVPTYITETLVKTKKVTITKEKTKTRDVHVKEYVVNTKTITKTKSVTAHIPQYLPAITVTSTQYETKTRTERLYETRTVIQTASSEEAGYSAPDTYLVHKPMSDITDFKDMIPYYGSFSHTEKKVPNLFESFEEQDGSTYASIRAKKNALLQL